jgi:hypothetical protein
VFVGATEIIVGNAPEEFSGVAGGMQQSAMQVGGSLGTAVLGALITAQVASVLPGHFTDAGLPAPTAGQVDQMKGIVASGFAPVSPQTPAQAVDAITSAAHLSFMDGMQFGFTVSAGVAVLAALLALFVKAGRKTEGAQVHLG